MGVIVAAKSIFGPSSLPV